MAEIVNIFSQMYQNLMRYSTNKKITLHRWYRYAKTSCDYHSNLHDLSSKKDLGGTFWNKNIYDW